MARCFGTSVFLFYNSTVERRPPNSSVDHKCLWTLTICGVRVRHRRLAIERTEKRQTSATTESSDEKDEGAFSRVPSSRREAFVAKL